MRKTMSAFIVAIVLAVMCSAITAQAQAQAAGERFGIGMFSYQDSTFVGLAMRYPTELQEIGGVVVELAAATEAATRQGFPTMCCPLSNSGRSWGLGSSRSLPTSGR